MLKTFSYLFISIFLFTAPANAKSIRTPKGNFPRIQWAIVEATTGNLEKTSKIGTRVLASTSAKESGTYALYGAIEKENPDLIRLLEIYKSDEASTLLLWNRKTMESANSS